MLDGSALGGAPLVYTAVWCVCVLEMGVCASSGSVGFWPIIPTALRSQLRSHAHFWHSFPDMITIHLPLWVLAPRNISIIPEWNWNNVPEMNSAPPCSVFSPRPPCSTPLSPPHTTHLQHRFLLSCRKNPPVRPFSPLSQLFVSAGMIGSFGSDISSLTSC